MLLSFFVLLYNIKQKRIQDWTESWINKNLNLKDAFFPRSCLNLPNSGSIFCKCIWLHLLKNAYFWLRVTGRKLTKIVENYEFVMNLECSFASGNLINYFEQLSILRSFKKSSSYYLIYMFFKIFSQFSRKHHGIKLTNTYFWMRVTKQKLSQIVEDVGFLWFLNADLQAEIE